jgi:hypothetical protein
MTAKLGQGIVSLDAALNQNRRAIQYQDGNAGGRRGKREEESLTV